MDTSAQLHALDLANLTDLTRQSVGSDTIEVSDWHVQPIGSELRNPTTGGVYRVAGTGHDCGTTLPWSLVLKVVRASYNHAVVHEDIRAHDYWKREALVYHSGLLDNLPGGLMAPRCFGVVEKPGGEIWIWLEELIDSYGHAWSLPQYALAARILGSFNGVYLAGQPPPTYPWLSTGWLRSLTANQNAVLDQVRNPRTWEHPLLHRAFPMPVAERMLRLFGERELFFAALDRLPKTLCHFDANRKNLYARLGTDGQDQIVAIDWGFLGHGAVGEDISLLVWSSLLEFKIELDQARRLEELVFESYMTGLHDVDWRGDPKLVRLGYILNAALQWGCAPPALTFALHESAHAVFEQTFGHPIEELVEHSAAVTYLLLDRLDEARALLASL